MKKYIAFSLTLILITVLFTSCSVFKNTEKDESTTESTSLSQDDMPTVTDVDGNVIDYTVSTTEGESEEGVENPYMSVGSLDDINERAGTSIKKPAGVTVTNEEFDVNDSFSPVVACYSFMVNGNDYSLWAGKKTGSMIMGIYLDDGTEVGENFTGTEEIAPTKYDDGALVARWFKDGVQYNLYAKDISLDEFKMVYSKVK